MGRFAAVLLISGVSLGRFAAFVLIAMIAVPALAATPAEPVGPMLGVPENFNLIPKVSTRQAESDDRTAYPTDQPRVPVNDGLRPPQLLWYPSPASLVKVVPAKVRYKLKF